MTIWYDYLDELQNKKTLVKVFLTSGTMLKGIIVKFDDYSLILDDCLIERNKVISIALLD